MGYTLPLVISLLVAVFYWVKAVEYLQSGVTVAIHKDISSNITKYFWDDFRRNLKHTVFCRGGCVVEHGDDRLMTAIASNTTIYNFTIDEVDFNTDDHVMVLIESSQTIKIVIEKFFFNSSFNFVARSPLYFDEGSGNLANKMTITLAISPSY